MIAQAGGATGSARVEVGRPPAVLENFEDISGMRALAVRATASLTSAMRPDPVRAGTRSARLAYDFTGAEPGTSAAYVNTGFAGYTPTSPLDQGIHRVRLEATDKAGNPAQPFGDWSFTVQTHGRRRP